MNFPARSNRIFAKRFTRSGEIQFLVEAVYLTWKFINPCYFTRTSPAGACGRLGVACSWLSAIYELTVGCEICMNLEFRVFADLRILRVPSFRGI